MSKCDWGLWHIAGHKNGIHNYGTLLFLLWMVALYIFFTDEDHLLQSYWVQCEFLILYQMNTTFALFSQSTLAQKQVIFKYLAFLSESQYISPVGTKSYDFPDYLKRPLARLLVTPTGEMTELWTSYKVNVAFVFCLDEARWSPRSSIHIAQLCL